MTPQEFFARVWEMLIGRVDGPFNFRLLVQPTVAAISQSVPDCETPARNRPPFSCGPSSQTCHSPRSTRQGWTDVGKVFIVAVILDLTYDLIVYRWVYPGQALIVAAVLAFIPYLMIRGPVTRIARRFVVHDRTQSGDRFCPALLRPSHSHSRSA